MNVLDGDNPTDTQIIQKGAKPTQELSYKAKIIPKCIVDTIPSTPENYRDTGFNCDVLRCKCGRMLNYSVLLMTCLNRTVAGEASRLDNTRPLIRLL